MKRSFLVQSMENFHEYFHLGFGMLSLAICSFLFPSANFTKMLPIAILASFIPDIDHLFFMFLYGRHTSYSTKVRKYLSLGDFSNAIEYCRINHKKNHFILSHNLITPLVFFFLSAYFYLQTSPYLTIFCLSFAMHFVFDIIEDYLALGKLNSNWYFRFKIPSDI